jgi:hypothetical protein
MRWITLLGRIGTVILMIGLALLVAWLIPSGNGSWSGFGQPIEPEQYMTQELGTYSPQTGLQISVESSDNVRVYLVGVSQGELDNWRTLLSEAYPDLEMFGDFYTIPLIFFHEAYPEEILPDLEDPLTWDMMWDIAVLDRGLQAHPEIILWGPPPSSTFSHEFFPTDVLPIWVIVANPSPDTVTVEIKVWDLTALAPKERVILPAILLISIGVALAIPWLILRKVKKSTL